jgi:hypothetical protein
MLSSNTWQNEKRQCSCSNAKQLQKKNCQKATFSAACVTAFIWDFSIYIKHRIMKLLHLSSQEAHQFIPHHMIFLPKMTVR